MRLQSSADMLAEMRAKQAAETGVQAKPVTVNRLRDLKDGNGVRDMPMIDPRIIVVEDGFNCRDYTLSENRAHLDELKRSIRANGTLVPLLVRYDAASKSAILVDGECRLRANLELIAEGVEIMAVPTVQVSGGNEAERLLNSITANTGKPLSKWELGTAFQRLFRFGWNEDQIATKTGYSLKFITEAMELADAPVEVKQMLSTQAVTPSLALEQLRVNGSAAVQSLQAIARERKASGKRGPAGNPVSKVPAPLPAPTLVAVLRELVADVSLEELTDTSKERITVNRLLLLKLASYAVTINQSNTTVQAIAA